MHPVLKWAGGKRQLLPALLAQMPSSFGRLIEPFLGGGALFFAMEREGGLIADANPELINLYRALAEDADAVNAALSAFQPTSEGFYAARALDWRTLAPHVAAARMLFLNRTCYNGLYRVNRRGEFNVPYGRHASVSLPGLGDLRAAGRLLATADIALADFETTASRAEAGDLVFLDPPYVPTGVHADFKRYTSAPFSLADHERLAGVFRALAARGAWAVLTNSDHAEVRTLYAGFRIEALPTRRSISKLSATRKGVDVVVFSW